MRLAIADPPYLGRADRWYGKGRGSGRALTTNGRPASKPDYHPEAADWDDPRSHVDLIERLNDEFDGWAVAGHASSTAVLMSAAPRHAHLAIWNRPNALPGGSRVMNTWEPVVILVPEGRRARDSGPRVRDLLTASVRHRGFLGAKPPEWTRWVLSMLGYEPDVDLVEDLFPGSGAVSREVSGMLSIWPTDSERAAAE